MCIGPLATGPIGRQIAQSPTISGGATAGFQNIARQTTGLSGSSQAPAPQRQTQGGSLLGTSSTLVNRSRNSLLGSR